jgi:hypothetical protein
MRRYFWLLVIVAAGSCAPKQQIVFRKALNIRFEAVNKQPVLKADLVFFNPNKDNAKLKRIDMKILVEDKTAGIVDQTLNQKIMGDSEFSVPIEIKLNLKEMGLLDTLINLFGGKKYKVHMVGKVRVSVNGFAISVPVDQEEELRIRM